MQEQIETPVLTVDGVVLAGDAPGQPIRQVLLIWSEKFQKWALPGGKVRKGEETPDAVRREVKEEVGVDLLLWARSGVFDRVGRDERGRYVSVAYYVVIARQLFRAGSDAKSAVWFDLEGLPPLAYDHAKIIEKALECARGAGE